LTAREQQPISGPPRHRLVEDNTDAYVPSDARIPTPTYVGTARPNPGRPQQQPPFQELEPDETPTLIDMATRRAARDSGERWRESDARFHEPRSDQVAPGRRGRRRRPVDGALDERYWVS
jgi:hypothetical protein